MNEYYKNIASEELFDYEDYYNWVAEWLPDNCRIAEIGIADGRSMIYLAAKLEELGKTCTLYAIDNMSYGGWKQTKEVVDHIVKSNLKTITLLTVDSLIASCQFSDGFFDFVFIDASHKYEETKADISLWKRKIKVGGILAGHDYLGIAEVRNAVDESLAEHYIRVYKTLKNHGIWEILF